jgi:hypothetical protein
LEALVQLTDVLDLLRRLIQAADHPDIAEVRVYAGGDEPLRNGVDVKDQRGGHMFLAGAQWKGETPVEVPELLPPPKLGAQRIAILTVKLLDAARPAELKAWRLVALPDLGPTDARGVAPAGVSLVAADGTKILLRAMHGGSQTGDPAEDPHPDWRVPGTLTV